MRALSLQRLAIILGLSVFLGALNAWFNPDAPAWSAEEPGEGEIAIRDALEIADSALWVDARSESDYAEAHVDMAISLNEDNWDAQVSELLMAWQPDQRIIVYCSSRQCQASHSVAVRLREEMGLQPVYVLHGGWEAWNDR